jgi:acetoin utilization protein AcuB
MLVGERMTRPVITVRPDLPIQEALSLMRKEHIRRLPVVNDKGKLIGIVSERQLLHASPSTATALSVFELTYLLSKVTIERVMTPDPLTVTEDTPVEEAARIMADKKIGGLPVMRGGELVGIITETDLFEILLELLGARTPGVRLTALIREAPGELARLTSAVRDAGGDFVALGTFLGESPENATVTIKVTGVEREKLRKAVEPIVLKVLDLREMKSG